MSGITAARKRVQGRIADQARQRVNARRTVTVSAKEADQVDEEKPKLWQPFAGPQTDALMSDADELYYGGSAGGGKTDLIIGLALVYHLRSLILRRESTQLNAIADRCREVIGTNGRFNENKGRWTGLPGGRMIELGGCPYLDDRMNYNGRPHDLKAFDELPQFLEAQYLYITAWNRTSVFGQRCRIVSAGNPPTDSDGEWVIRRWGAWLDSQHANKAVPGELRWYAMIDDKDTEVENGDTFTHGSELIVPRSRTFIPASVDDNPVYRATGYKAMLQSLEEPLRSQLLYGSFEAGRSDDEWQVIPTDWIRLAQKRWVKRASEPDFDPGMLNKVSLDPSRGGKDETALAPMYEDFVGEIRTWEGKVITDGFIAAQKVTDFLGDNPDDAEVLIDVIGIGASGYDQLKYVYNEVTPVNNAIRSRKRDRSKKFVMYNIRAEAMWTLREELNPEYGATLCLPPDNELLRDLCSARYEVRGQHILIESKEDIKARIGRSPNKGDAVCMLFLLGRPIRTERSIRTGLPEDTIRSNVNSQTTGEPMTATINPEGLFVPPVRPQKQTRRF